MSAQQPITVLVVGGTGESGVDDRRTDVSGLLAHVVEHLDDRFVARWVPYPASYGPAPTLSGMSYADSVAQGCANLRAAFDATEATVMMLGYSQGAVVVSEFIADLARENPAALRRVAALGLLADPHQPAGVVEGCDGFGVAGASSVVGVDAPVPTYWVGAQGDMICNASEDSLIRDIADLTGQLGVGSARDVRMWLSAMWKTLRSDGFQNSGATVVAPSQWRRDLTRLAVAGREVAGYLPSAITWGGRTIRNPRGGRHTSYGVEPYRARSLTDADATGCEILARHLQVAATFLGESTCADAELAG